LLIVIVLVSMGLFRKLRKFASIHLLQEDAAPPPPPPRPHGRHRRRGDVGPPADNSYEPLPRSFLHAVNSAREEAGYDSLPVFPQGPIPVPDRNPMHQQFSEEFGRGRSKSHDRAFRHQPPGTPVKFRRRPISPDMLQPHASSPFLFRQRPSSPDLLQPHASSPFLFRQHSVPASPDVIRRFQHEQHIARQQHQQQQQMMMPQPGQFYPQFQQPFYPMMNPNVNMHPWLMAQQPQMHPFF
jgi:hypothetical protein